jgi:hypothetical protein
MYEAESTADTANTGDSGDVAQAACSEGSSNAACDEAANMETTLDEMHAEVLEQFPPEIATLLIVAGVAGVLLPGPIGAPLILAGGVTLWPKTFRPIERWFSRKFPAMHKEGVIQLKEFVNDLKSRYPDLR